MTNDGRAVSYEDTGAYAHAVAVSDVWRSGIATDTSEGFPSKGFYLTLLGCGLAVTVLNM